jgi:hypothetical protein
LNKIISAGLVGGMAAASILGAGVAQAATTEHFLHADGTHWTNQELVVAAANRSVEPVAGLVAFAPQLPVLLDAWWNDPAPVQLPPELGGGTFTPTRAQVDGQIEAGLVGTVGSLVDSPQRTIDPLIEKVAINVPRQLGGGSDGIPENGPNAPGDGAIIQFRDTTLLKVRNDTRTVVAGVTAKTFEASTKLRDDVLKPAVAKHEANKVKRQAVRTAVHQAVHQAIKKTVNDVKHALHHDDPA